LEQAVDSHDGGFDAGLITITLASAAAGSASSAAALTAATSTTTAAAMTAAAVTAAILRTARSGRPALLRLRALRPDRASPEPRLGESRMRPARERAFVAARLGWFLQP
jgi:hypothetical protein